MAASTSRVELRGYAIAAAAVAAALLASLATWPHSPSSPWVFLFTAVIATAWYGGLRASLAATAALAVLGRYFFMTPYRVFTLERDDAILVLLFVAVSTFIACLVAARRRAEDRVRAERRRYRATVDSIGDAVVAADAEGRVEFLNGVAEGLTGWTLAEARGARIGDVFVVVDEATRGPVANPAEEVLRTGRVGLANQAVLIARGGAERFIDANAAPIVEDDRVAGVVLVFRDVTDRVKAAADRERAEEEVRASERRFRLTADNAPVLIWLAGPDGGRSWFNKPWLEFTGRTMEQEAGRGWAEGVHPDDRDRCLRVLDESARAGSPFKMDYRLRRRDGEYRWIVDDGVPLGGRDGEAAGSIGSCVDIQDRVAAEEELKENDRRKDEFLAMLAHELRNPMAAVGNAVAVLEASDAPEDVAFATGVIGRQTRHLTRLIDDLLDVSRISRGKIRLRKERIDAAAVLDAAVASARPLIERRGHDLEVAVDRGRLVLDADPTRLEQMVVNLLNNAAKFSDDGGLVRLSARREGEEVVIRVEDQGIGIPPEKLRQVFELFAQGDRSLARSEGGLGIGLTVVRKLAELHGGTVEVRSEGPGRGSEFTIRLPAADGLGEDAPAPGATAERPRGGPLRILVVDDNMDSATGLAKLLRLLGHRVETAYTGPESLAAAREHSPEVVLLDIGLPGMDGYEVAASLRREGPCKDALIVAVSGYGRDEDRRRSREAGFDRHLIKPVDRDALAALLAEGRPDRAGPRGVRT
ncbi:hybrid sensor histidine kinase/response regulator [Paludisphaera soli]|uniref:hybrid sensor histidine kinase/response regulator n=1 Tax=Paludisphaera soli TaxID=2712865 RepID=UPI0013EBC4C9|nr:PAS domain S-box protein [Paludisphaera soli]